MTTNIVNPRIFKFGLHYLLGITKNILILIIILLTEDCNAFYIGFKVLKKRVD